VTSWDNEELELEGRTWVRGAISTPTLEAMDTGFAVDGNPGARFTLFEAKSLLSEVAAIVRLTLPCAEPVRVLAFDKTEANNWVLPWHQDRVAALAECVETPGFSNWTNKAGVWHSEPPLEFLERMVFARVHLDPVDEENGCLQVALGTHLRGKVAASEAKAVAEACPVEKCIADRGDVLLAKALILHRSSPSQANRGRRAVRIDYCADSLPAPLEWAA
jgi:hypothetical protein